MSSVLNVDTIADKAGTGPVALTKQSAAKAWCAMSDSASLDDSFNVSSATDVSTGHYLVSLTNSMNNSNYSGTSASQHSAARHVHIFDRATGNYDVHQFLSTNQTFADGTGTNSVIHGDLA